jgi:hypothetical protein
VDEEDKPRKGVTTRRCEGDRGRMALVPLGTDDDNGALFSCDTFVEEDDARAMCPRDPDIGVGVSGGVGGGSRVGLRGVVGELGTLIGAVGAVVTALRGLDFVARWRETRSLAGVGGRSLRFR